MAAGIVEVVQTYQGASNLARDRYVNTYHFELSDDTDTALMAIARNRIQSTLMNSTSGGRTATLNSYLASYINLTTGNKTEVYRLADPEPRPPYVSAGFTRSSPSATGNLPFEVALCMSFRSQPIPGIPQGRLRNRVYIGPFNDNARTTVASLPSRPAADLVSNMAISLQELAAANDADVVWCGYSGRSGVGFPLDFGWIDNEWDTQRRRGQASTARTTVSL